MRHVMIAGMDNQPLYPSDGTIGGEDVFPPAHLYFSHGHSVIGDRLRAGGTHTEAGI